MTKTVHEKQREVLQRLAENHGSEVLALVKQYCALEYEKLKESLVREESNLTRGKAQMCRSIVKDFTFE